MLLVDADLRRPRVAGYLGLGSGAGLTDVLIGEVAVEDVLQPWGDKSLLVLPGARCRRTPASCSARRPWPSCCCRCAS
ncbi:hypothetical protein [Plantactinospora veratri]